MYRWIEHTAELELELEGGTDEEVFAQAVAAFAELLGDDQQDGDGGAVAHQVFLQADDRAGQLVELLEELVFLADTERFVPERLSELDLDRKRALVEGHAGAPPPLVKAVTYHGLQFAPEGDGWRARVVLDV